MITTTSFMMYLSLVQGVYYLITGIWPLISMRTFQMVTGPKTDHWLVNTVGVLILVIGIVLIFAGVRHNITYEILMLALGSAVGLTAIDSIYVMKKRIAPIYLLDALVQIPIIGSWIYILIHSACK
ncbi:conserved hypothetical protein [Candidatus Jettenia caeni]|uniref:Uncharacterized protein n=1 Tax=Candidatus Jettenia caeni TaxID=247490 RepID=I3IP17_9BACT|nr:hypothetical protein [Candidatus Jettenia sp. AMX1]WKZ15918.1 MAG: hypothetical protein QY317_01170 [Candidatus Jettenia caeni]GAB63462.1 conserved hypothetical protein [Candidatus Jettenia caeni]